MGTAMTGPAAPLQSTGKVGASQIMEMAFNLVDGYVVDVEPRDVRETVCEELGEDFYKMSEAEQEEVIERVDKAARSFVGAVRSALDKARAVNGLLASFL